MLSLLLAMYKEYKPSTLLSPYIETYWVSNDSIEGEQTIRILPDGCVDIIFNWKENFVPFIIGTMTSFLDVTYRNTIQMMGVRFRPCGITAFSRVPVSEFTNIRTDISLVETIFEPSFYEELFIIGNDGEKLGFLDLYLLKQLRKTFSLDQQMTHVVTLIRETKGVQPISKIIDSICLSPRQFERKFKATIGISPKTFSSITRFTNAKEVLEHSPTESLFSIALDCGYYDHSHLIREYKRFAGSLPDRL